MRSVLTGSLSSPRSADPLPPSDALCVFTLSRYRCTPCAPPRGRLIPTSTHRQETKRPTNRLESLALQHELFTFSGFAGLRLFASFLKLDQGFRMKASPALKTHSILQTIGWSEVSSLKVMNASGTSRPIRSRTRRSGSPPSTM